MGTATVTGPPARRFFSASEPLGARMARLSSVNETCPPGPRSSSENSMSTDWGSAGMPSASKPFVNSVSDMWPSPLTSHWTNNSITRSQCLRKRRCRSCRGSTFIGRLGLVRREGTRPRGGGSGRAGPGAAPLSATKPASFPLCDGAGPVPGGKTGAPPTSCGGQRGVCFSASGGKVGASPPASGGGRAYPPGELTRERTPGAAGPGSPPSVSNPGAGPGSAASATSLAWSPPSPVVSISRLSFSRVSAPGVSSHASSRRDATISASGSSASVAVTSEPSSRLSVLRRASWLSDSGAPPAAMACSRDTTRDSATAVPSVPAPEPSRQSPGRGGLRLGSVLLNPRADRKPGCGGTRRICARWPRGDAPSPRMSRS
eukprot:scaffold17421_cov79-Isochrysis_galbana.AAC.1